MVCLRVEKKLQDLILCVNCGRGRTSGSRSISLRMKGLLVSLARASRRRAAFRSVSRRLLNDRRRRAGRAPIELSLAGSSCCVRPRPSVGAGVPARRRKNGCGPTLDRSKKDAILTKRMYWTPYYHKKRVQAIIVACHVLLRTLKSHQNGTIFSDCGFHESSVAANLARRSPARIADVDPTAAAKERQGGTDDGRTQYQFFALSNEINTTQYIAGSKAPSKK